MVIGGSVSRGSRCAVGIGDGSISVGVRGLRCVELVNVMSRGVASRHVTSCHGMSRHVVASFLSYGLTSCQVTSRRYVMSYDVVFCRFVLRRIMSCDVVSCLVINKSR